MNNYQIKIYNSTDAYNGRILSNIIINNFNENLHYIDLCEKSEIISFKPWIGVINSLNCNNTHLDYYISMNMNLLLTTPNVKIKSVPTGNIEHDFYQLVPKEYSYNAYINQNFNFFEDLSTYLIMFLVFFIALNLILKLYKLFVKFFKQYKEKISIKTIKFTDDYQYKNCTICLEDFELNSKLSVLNCDHIYHQKCINEWIGIKNDIYNVKCPNCNSNIYSDELLEHLI